MQNRKTEMPSKSIKFVDLFCGIGGFRLAVDDLARENNLTANCVLSSDIDSECQNAYEANYGHRPIGDIKQVDENIIPAHDLLLGGFPCQAFSIIGQMKGFADMRGTLFFDIARILKAKKPSAFILENVKLLTGHNEGKTFKRILETLRDLGYYTNFRVLNALKFGLPQKRERVFIVGLKNADAFSKFEWPEGGFQMTPLKQILEKNVAKKHYASDRIRLSRLTKLQPTNEPTIWHENKAGHVSAYPFSCALRAGASYNYLLVNGERRLTPREMLRLQGFPETFKIVCNDSQTRKQAGNSVPVNLVRAVAEKVLEAQGWITRERNGQTTYPQSSSGQMRLLEKSAPYGRTTIENRRKARTTLPA
ncbi:MAG: DNA (cytosine-5-)-methyltransferase [Verrucomicrobiota bacterium]|nr:DNA (cytosine-5-)-methyltransferase [Verrucomicrobiota bacterium]